MAAWRLSLESERDPLWGRYSCTQQCGGLTGVRGRAPARVSSCSQPWAQNQVGKCSTYARRRAWPRGRLAGDKSPSEGRSQEKLWRQFFLDPTLWWDNRRNKNRSLRSPDFRHRKSQEGLWLKNFYKPDWVDGQLAALDMRVDRSPSHRRLPDGSDACRPAGDDKGVTAETVRRLCDEDRLTEAVDALEVLVQTDSCISKSLFNSVLKKCIVRKDLVLGRRVHACTVKKGYQKDTFLCNHILRMYASHGRLQDAMDVFEAVAEPDAFTWSAIVSAHVKHGQDKQAIELYHRMRRSSVKPDGHVFVAALQACARGSDLKSGQQVHVDVLASGVEPDQFVCNCLVSMYAKCGSLEDAQGVFDGLGRKDVVTWNAMIAGYSQQGMGQEALRLYSAMQEEGMAAPDSVTFVCLLKACASAGTSALEQGKRLHAQIKAQGHQADLNVANSLVNMYAKCGSLEDAQGVFNELGQKDLVTWNAMIAGYAKQGMGQEALHLYSAMQEGGKAVPNSVTFVCLLQACASVGTLALKTGKQLHTQIREQGYQDDLVVASSLVNIYAKCGSLQDAQRVFDGLGQKNVVTWTAMIAGYSQQGMGLEALRLYSAMQEEGIAVPDSITFVCLLKACASVGSLALEEGKHLHVQIREQGHQADVAVANSLVNMYAKCGSLEDARSVFDGVGEKDVVTWTAMIAAYSQQGMGNEALQLYSAMQGGGMAVPDSVTFVYLLQACASVGNLALAEGKYIHVKIKEGGHQVNVLVANSLVNMYAKCGSLKDAQRVFDGLGQKDLMTWNALIAGYSQQGMGQEALGLHTAMQQEGLTVANSVTFVSLLQACANLGTLGLEKGKQLHVQIREEGHQADMFVANSLVNMYAKCGSLGDAQRVFDELGQKDVVTWNAMIAGYSQHGMGQEALLLYDAMQAEDLTVPNCVTFVSLLQACASVGSPALEKGEQLHVHIRERGYEADVFVANSLVNMYAKCGSLEHAQIVFDRLRQKDLVTWNTMIAGYSQQGMWEEALRLYSDMQQVDMPAPDSVTFVCLLQACACVGPQALDKGKHLHALINEQGHQADMFIANSLVHMYAKCGSLHDAEKVFDELDERDVVTWNVMIGGYSQQGLGQEALCLYRTMQEEGKIAADSVTYVCLLQACATMGTLALEDGKHLHMQIKEQGHQGDVVIANGLVNMYAKCGSLADAQRVFDGLGQKDVLTWNAMISGYTQQGLGKEALRLLTAMQEAMDPTDSATYVFLLQACASIGSSALDKGKQLHAQIKEQGHKADLFVASSLMDMYAKCGRVEDARTVFDGLGEKDVVTWTAIISGYSQQGMGQEALSLYCTMQEEGIAIPDSVTFVCLLQACASVGNPALEMGKHLHKEIRDRGHQADRFVANSLVNMYAKCGSLEDAQRVFDHIGEKDVVTWNAIIAGYSHQGMGQEALRLYSAMQEERMVVADSMTFVFLLQACASVGTLALEKGMQLHAVIREQGHQADVLVANSLVNMYAKCGSLENAQRVFDGLGRKDVVTWNAMIAAYSQRGMGQEALRLYSAMQHEDMAVPDVVTFVCLLQACANVAALYVGRQLHAQAVEQGLQADLFVAGSLINMYGKSGSMVDAQNVFDALTERDVVVWNALIGGYTSHGDTEVVFDLVQKMRVDGIRPDGITFLSVLTVCSHSGLVNKGWEYFEAMSRDSGITPMEHHYTCMVDLLGRAGQLDEALGLVRTMPVLPNADVWHTLLGSCQKWSNVDVGCDAFREAVKLDKKDAAAYVLMSNIYTGAQIWDRAQKAQVRRKQIRAWKQPGQSWWTDEHGLVHSFFVGDEKHPESPARRKHMYPKMTEGGSVLHSPPLEYGST